MSGRKTVQRGRGGGEGACGQSRLVFVWMEILLILLTHTINIDWFKKKGKINTLEVGNEKLTNKVIDLSRGGKYESDLLSLLGVSMS